MKKFIAIVFIGIFSVFTVMAQDVTGTWKTIDDESGEAKSYVEIYKRDGKVYGKVTKILNPEKQDAICVDCPEWADGKPILGLEIIKGLEKDDEEYNDGEILDPNSGKVYDCYIELIEPDKLKVRGFIGFSLLGRTQYWYRVK